MLMKLNLLECGALILVFLFTLLPKKNWVISLNLAWFFFSAWQIFGGQNTPIENAPDQWVLAFDYAAIYSLVCVIAAMSISKFNLRKIFIYLGYLNAALLIFWDHGIFLNASMSGCFLAVSIPLLFNNLLSGSLMVVAIFMTRQSLPIATLFVALCAGFFAQKKWRELVIASVIAIPCGFLVAGRDLFDTNGRMTIWASSIQFLHESGKQIVGLGAGSFSLIGPKLSKNPDHLFTWMHSDILQIYFEQGIIGLILFFGLAAFSLIKSYKNPPLFAAVVAYLFFMSANMPAHYVISGVYGFWMLRTIFSPASLPQVPKRQV